MTQNESSEKELVLGNKQLISLFFVGVALCGVFFAMGYMVGHNSSKTILPNETAAAVTAEETIRRQQPEPPRETAAEQPAPLETKPMEARPLDTKPAETKPAATPPAATIAIAAPDAGSSYLQVTALPRPDADNMIRTLREQNFPVILAASSKPELFRVLVGPFLVTAQLADAKNKLKALGFNNAFVQKQ